MFNKLLSVDPGDNTAWSFFNEEYMPVVGIFQADKHLTHKEQFITMSIRFKNLLENMRPAKVLIEGVGFWEGSDKSRVSAQRGNTFKLAYLIGIYVARCIELEIDFEIIDARHWKKSLSKAGTLFRVQKILNALCCDNEHIIDAIGLGLSTNEEIWRLKKSIEWKTNKQKRG